MASIQIKHVTSLFSLEVTPKEASHLNPKICVLTWKTEPDPLGVSSQYLPPKQKKCVGLGVKVEVWYSQDWRSYQVLCGLQDWRNRGWRGWKLLLVTLTVLPRFWWLSVPSSFFHNCGLSPRTLEDVFSPGYFVWVGFCSILLRVWGKQITWRTRWHFRTFLYGLFFLMRGPNRVKWEALKSSCYYHLLAQAFLRLHITRRETSLSDTWLQRLCAYM